MGTKVYTPNRAYRGFIGGVPFRAGVGDLDEILPGYSVAGAMAYFAKAGYGIGEPPDGAFDRTPDWDQLAESRAPESVDAAVTKDAGGVVSDAFLPPTNAGDEDPHGPLVVSPEIHGPSGPKGIKPGDVHVGEPAEQEAAETALAEQVLVQGQEHPAAVEPPPAVEAAAEVAAAPSAPAKNARRKDWQAFAVSQGMDADEAKGATRGELIERFGG